MPVMLTEAILCGVGHRDETKQWIVSLFLCDSVPSAPLRGAGRLEVDAPNLRSAFQT
jgi:hypothetical protein